MALFPDLFGASRLTDLSGRMEQIISKVDRLLEIAYEPHVAPGETPGAMTANAYLYAHRRAPRGFSGENVAVAGIFKTRCGLQRAADLTYLQMKQTQPAACAVDLSERLGTPLTLDRTDVITPDQARRSGVSDVIISLNPPLFTAGLKQFVAPDGERPNIVGYWVWELNKVSEDWHFAASLCDEIWAPSEFVRATMATELTGYEGAIKTVPYAVDLDPMERATPQLRAAARARFGLDERDFVVGTTFSFSSCYARKNPTAAIDAFWEAFGAEGKGNAKLLIRCSDAHVARHLMTHLVSYAGDDSRVRVFPTEGAACPLREFYNSLDTYISLHRSEGYGLTLMEAAQVGMPVITTGWGLAADIEALSCVHSVGYRLIAPIEYQNLYDHLDGALWAEPDAREAAALLRKIHGELAGV